MSRRLHLQLWPDWRASSLAGRARFAALVKLCGAGTIAESATIEIRLLDAGGTVVEVETAPLTDGHEGLVGPAWRVVPGHLVTLPESVSHAQGALPGAVSVCESRADAEVTVLLRSCGPDLGLPGEPYLWWCYRNQGADPVVVTDLLRSRVLWVDGHPLAAPEAAYNGPSRLDPGRGLSAWWSTDDLHGIPRQVTHRFRLEVLGQRSADVTISA
jgi:hypothetical protein